MIHIAICDDDSVFISIIKRIIIESGIEPQRVVFSEYTSGESFICDLESRKECDLLILDMQMGDMDGDYIAKRFREIYPYTTLVFCSGVMLPTVNSFKATPFRYLLKSFTDEQMIEEMKEIIKEAANNKEEVYVLGHYRHSAIKVKLSNIMYILNSKRGSRIFVTPECKEYDSEDQILLDDKIADLYEQYCMYGFEFASSSYIVNMRYVKKITPSEVILFGDEKLPLTRSYYKQFREIFTKNLAGKY